MGKSLLYASWNRRSSEWCKRQCLWYFKVFCRFRNRPKILSDLRVKGLGNYRYFWHWNNIPYCFRPLSSSRIWSWFFCFQKSSQNSQVHIIRLLRYFRVLQCLFLWNDSWSTTHAADNGVFGIPETFTYTSSVIQIYV